MSKILVIEPTGAATHVYCESSGAQVCAVFAERLALKPGETVWLKPRTETAHVFDSATGRVLH